MVECAWTLLSDDIPGVVIESDGVSNLAKQAKWRLEHEVFYGDDAAQRLGALVAEIKRQGKGKDYDCIIGLSGGVDSSYVALKVVELGLRPLAVHLDNGWNSDLAVSNIEKIINRLGIDLYTHVVDWKEIRDLQRSYIKGGLLDLECVSDHAINSVLFKMARKQRVKYLLHGGNVASESIHPAAWVYDKRDGRNVRAIHRKFGDVPLKTYPSMGGAELFFHIFVRRLRTVAILNYVGYNKTRAMDELEQRLGWQRYARKHGENRFTRFFQEYNLPEKFKIDKRIIHLSSLIVAGEITKEQAIAEINKPLYNSNEKEEELRLVAKKLQFSAEELKSFIEGPKADHKDFPNLAWMFDHDSLPTQLARNFAKGELNMEKAGTLWEKYGKRKASEGQD